MDWVWVVGFLGWPVMWWFGYMQAKEKVQEPTLAGALPPQDDTGRFLVVARLKSGARARQILERAKVGDGEVVELWDGDTCRGRKGPTEG